MGYLYLFIGQYGDSEFVGHPGCHAKEATEQVLLVYDMSLASRVIFAVTFDYYLLCNCLYLVMNAGSLFCLIVFLFHYKNLINLLSFTFICYITTFSLTAASIFVVVDFFRVFTVHLMYPKTHILLCSVSSRFCCFVFS